MYEGQEAYRLQHIKLSDTKHSNMHLSAHLCDLWDKNHTQGSL